MEFAIRDDDTSYWTTPSDLELVYGKIWQRGIPVSLAVVPAAVKSHNLEDRTVFYQEEAPRFVYENGELVSFLKDKIRKHHVSIMLHGFSHLYKVALSEQHVPINATKQNLDILKSRKSDQGISWFGEYSEHDYETLRKKTIEGKKILEDTLGIKISTFVPPSNDISREGVRAVADCGLDISGTTILSRFNRDYNACFIKNWVLKAFWRIRYSRNYPYVMYYKKHRELCAYGLTPGVLCEDLIKTVVFCKQKSAPFVLATHHWEILINSDLGKRLELILNQLAHEKALTLEEIIDT